MCVCVMCSAFDTLAKVFNPLEVGAGQRLADKSPCVSGTTIQLIGRDQETPIIEVEGPLLTDSHVGFKVSGVCGPNNRHTSTHIIKKCRDIKLNPESIQQLLL